MALSEALQARLEKLVHDNGVVLFMKGDRTFPQCGFSAQVIQILDDYTSDYQTVNVLDDAEVRQGIKDFSDWPTIPQLYVKGEFVGGCDIIRDMHQSGELSTVLGKKPMEVEPPSITLTAPAVAAIAEAAQDAEYPDLRLEIGPRFDYGLSFGPRLAGDVEVKTGGMTLLLDKASARRANGMKIDFLEGEEGAGFKIENPNEPPRVKQMSVAQLKDKLQAGAPMHLFDVRGADERAIVAIYPSTLLDQAGQAALAALSKDEPVVLYCRSGRRSQAAAEQLLAEGYKDVTNVEGGVLAWADLHPGLAKY
jgi:monothiol glutaredoxin